MKRKRRVIPEMTLKALGPRICIMGPANSGSPVEVNACVKQWDLG